MPIVKKILLAIVVFVIAIFACVVAAYKLIDDKTIEDQTLKVLQNLLRREITIDGHFELTRSFNPTLKTSGIRIASADWDPDDSLLQAGRMEVGINLLSLLRGVVTIQTMIFENAVLNIKLNENGQSNLEFGRSRSSSDKRKSVNYLDIIGVEISQLEVRYSDKQDGTNIDFDLARLILLPKSRDVIQMQATSSINGQPLEINASSCRIRHFLRDRDCDIIAQVNSVPFETRIEGNLRLDGNNNQLKVRTKGGDINDLALVKEASLPVTQNILAEFSLSGALDALRLDNLKGKIELIDTRAEFDGEIASVNSLRGVNISLQMTGTQPKWMDTYQNLLPGTLVDKFSINAQIKDQDQHWKIYNLDANVSIGKSNLTAHGEISAGTDLFQLMLDTNAEGTDPEWLNLLQETVAAEKIDKFSVQAKVQNPNNTWSIENIDASITAKNSILSAQGSFVYDPNTGPDVNVTVSALGDNLQDFEAVIKQTLPDSKQFSMNTAFAFKQSTITLDPLTLQIDGTKLQGNSEIELSSPPNIRAELSADSVNVEHIMSLLPTNTNEESDEPAETETTYLFSDEPIALDWLKTANTDVSLRIEKLIYKDAILNTVYADINAKDNQATFDLTSLEYLGASLRSSAAIDAEKKQYTFSLFTEAFDLGSLLKQMQVGNALTGIFDVSVDLAASGTSHRQIATATEGKVTAIMTEGSLADAPIDLLASNLLVELMPGRKRTDKTKIECMFMQLSVTDGVVKTDAALLNTENIVMTADGTVDLGQEALNFLLIPKPKNVELFTLDTNIRVKGDIVDPSFSLDKGSVFTKLIKSAATVALGPAASLAIPFATMGTAKQAKCFSEVAETTAKAIEAQEEAERKAREEAEPESTDETDQSDTDTPTKAKVEPLNR